MTDDELDSLVSELRDEAIQDGDPEMCLGWVAADAIDALRADREEMRGIAIDLRDLLANAECVVEAHHDLEAQLAAANTEKAQLARSKDALIREVKRLADRLTILYRENAALREQRALTGGSST